MNNNHAKASAKTISENDPIILEMLGSRYCEYRYFVAKLGFHLDKLKNDPNWAVRREVARKGVYLHKLKNDPDEDVRYAARQKLKELEEQRS